MSLNVAIRLDENGKPVWTNRRGTVRYLCAPATPGRVYSDTDKQFARGWVIDLSRTGAGLYLAEPLEIRRPVVLGISRSTSTDKIEMPAHVAHSTRIINGEWLVGFQFDSPLTDEQLEELL